MIQKRWVYQTLTQIVFPIYAAYLRINSYKSTDHKDYCAQRLGSYYHEKKSNYIVIVTEGLGEFQSIQTLVSAMQARFTSYSITIALTDLNAYRHAKKAISVSQLVYLPIDTIGAVNKFYQHFNPKLMVIIERALWPNLYYQARQRSIPSILLSGRISERSLVRYQYARQFFQEIYNNLAIISMQDTTNTERLLSLGIAKDKFTTEGNLKYTTNIISDADYARMRKQRSRWQTNKASIKIILAASTHAPEEQVLMRCLKALVQNSPEQDFRLIIVPRDITRANSIAQHANNMQLTHTNESDQVNEITQAVYIVDSFGKMLDYLAVADCAYIGGSWINHGGHNPLEAIKMRTMALTGPFNSNFTENWNTITQHALGDKVSTEEDLTKKLYSYLTRSDEQAYRSKFSPLLNSHSNTITTHIEIINNYLNSAASSN